MDKLQERINNLEKILKDATDEKVKDIATQCLNFFKLLKQNSSGSIILERLGKLHKSLNTYTIRYDNKIDGEPNSEKDAIGKIAEMLGYKEDEDVQYFIVVPPKYPKV